MQCSPLPYPPTIQQAARPQRTPMELHITSKEDMLRELEEMDAYLNITTTDDAAEITEYGNQVAVYVARAGRLLADAKHHLNTRMKEDTFDALRKTAKQGGATAKAINAIVDNLCAVSDAQGNKFFIVAGVAVVIEVSFLAHGYGVYMIVRVRAFLFICVMWVACQRVAYPLWPY